MVNSNDSINVYIGCACSNKLGSFAYIIRNNDRNYSFSGQESLTTINQMELIAAILALTKIKNDDNFKNKKIVIITNSRYVESGITSWINAWIKNNWKTSRNEPVKNQELWNILLELNKSLKMEWKWIKKNSDKYNKECNDLCCINLNNTYHW